MMMDQSFTFLLVERESDGMGGYISAEKEGSSFIAYSQPVKSEHILKTHGIVAAKPYQLVTKQKLAEPLESLVLVSNGKKYKIIQHLNLKYQILLVEVIE